MEATRHRRKLIINWQLQFRFALFCVALVDGIVAAAFAITFIIISALTTSTATPTIVAVVQDTVMPALFYSLIASLVLGTAITMMIAIRYSHKIAGPIYRIQRICNHVSDGNLGIHVGFRKKDVLRSLKDAFQDMIAGLREKVQGINGDMREVTRLATELRAGIDSENGGDRNDMREQTDRLRQIANRTMTTFTIDEQ